MKEVLRLLRESMPFYILATVLLFGGAWVGFEYSEAFEEQINLMLEQLEDIVEHITEKESSLYTAWFIFQNNTKAGLMLVTLGLFLFFAPGFSLFTNGLMIGYILQKSAENGVVISDIILYGLLPHGILELPAIIMAGGLGMFLGWRLFRWMTGKGGFFSHLFGEHRERGISSLWENRGKGIFKERLQATSALLILMIITLLVAALIESYITPILMEKMIGNLNI